MRAWDRPYPGRRTSTYAPPIARLLRSPRLRLALLAVAVAGAAIAVYALGGPSQAELQQVVDDAGPAAPVVFCLLYAGLTLLLFPGAIITAAGGTLFGVALGTALSVAGATLGATGAFLVGRRLGREQVEEIAGPRVGRIDRWLTRHGFLAVLYLRLVPVLPFNVLNYAVGVSGVRRWEYVVATALGIVPGAFAPSALGASLDDPTSTQFLVAVGLVVALAAGAPLVRRVLPRRGGAFPP
jgi:uncharacterized membrane protein YdjX (TVP38/TMEM64 family)